MLIDREHARLLDGPMKLKLSMPRGWRFRAGCIVARLHELNIDFVLPEEGLGCQCDEVAVV